MLISGPRKIGGSHRPSADTRRERYELERRAREAAAGDLPGYPGAHLVLITIDALRADRLGAYATSITGAAMVGLSWLLRADVAPALAMIAVPAIALRARSSRTTRSECSRWPRG